MLTSSNPDEHIFKHMLWQQIGSNNYHVTHLSSCKKWVSKSPLTRCGIVHTTFKPYEKERLLLCIKKTQVTIDVIFVYHENHIYYWQTDYDIAQMTRLESTSVSVFEMIFNLRELTPNKVQRLSCLELSLIDTPWLQHALIPFLEDEKTSCAQNVLMWETLNPKIPAYDLGTCWITRYCGNTPALDHDTDALIRRIFNLTGNLVLDACSDNNVLCYRDQAILVDFDLTVTPSTLNCLERINSYLNYWERLNRKPKSVATSRTLLYLMSSITHPPANTYPISDHLLRLLHHLRHKKITLTFHLLSMFHDISLIEKHPLDLENIYECYGLHQIIKGVYASTLMYYVSEGSLTQVKMALNLNPCLLARNIHGESVLDLALSYQNSKRDILIQVILKIASLTADAQRELLRTIPPGDYPNIFRYTLIHFPSIFILLSQQELWDSWEEELSYCMKAHDTLIALDLNNEIIRLEKIVQQSTSNTQLYGLIQPFLKQLQNARKRFLLSHLPPAQTTQHLINQCLNLCEIISKQLPPPPKPGILLSLFTFFSPIDDFYAFISTFQRKFQDIAIDNEDSYVIV